MLVILHVDVSIKGIRDRTRFKILMKKLVNDFLLNLGELGLLPCCGAFVTEAGFPEIIVSVEASIVAIAPQKLKSISPYCLILHGVYVHWNCMWVKLSFVGPFSDACRAMALQSEVSVRIRTGMPVTPLDTNISMLNINTVWGCDSLIRHARNLTKYRLDQRCNL